MRKETEIIRQRKEEERLGMTGGGVAEGAGAGAETAAETPAGEAEAAT